MWSNEGFIAFHDHLTTFLGIVFGYIMALFCYSCMMFAKARRPEYLWYGLFLIGFLLHSIALSGIGFQYLWSQAVGLQMVMGGASIGITFACLIKFTQIVIATNKKLYNFLFSAQVYLHLVASLLSIYTLNTFLIKLHLIAVLFSSFLVPIICLLTHREGYKKNIFFALVWLVNLCTSIFTMSALIGFSSLNLDPLYILFIGFHLQTLLIGSALVYEYRESFLRTLQSKETALIDKAKTVKVKDEILKLQQDAQNKLKQQVQAQTMQLEDALSDLSFASKELKLLRNIDALTGLPNRLAFEEALLRLSKLSFNGGEALCIAVIDIDYFKKVNDTYGYLAGDDCLRKFSSLLKATFLHEDYACCRFGGEEFVLATTLAIEKVEQQVNVFRLAVENMMIKTSAHTISITTSAGIASQRLIDAADSKKVFASADEKLYLAKQKGRNLVIA